MNGTVLKEAVAADAGKSIGIEDLIGEPDRAVTNHWGRRERLGRNWQLLGELGCTCSVQAQTCTQGATRCDLQDLLC